MATIRGELDAVLERRVDFKAMDVQRDAPYVGTWRALRIDARAKPSEDHPVWPRTARIIESLPGLGENAIVSALEPGAHILPHCGPWNARLTLHLPLVVPRGDCGFRVGTEARRWEEGRCLVFSDSFEHEAWNHGESTRFVLLVDLWHPELTTIEREVLGSVSKLAMQQLEVRLTGPGPSPDGESRA